MIFGNRPICLTPAFNEKFCSVLSLSMKLVDNWKEILLGVKKVFSYLKLSKSSESQVDTQLH